MQTLLMCIFPMRVPQTPFVFWIVLELTISFLDGATPLPTTTMTGLSTASPTLGLSWCTHLPELVRLSFFAGGNRMTGMRNSLALASKARCYFLSRPLSIVVTKRCFLQGPTLGEISRIPDECVSRPLITTLIWIFWRPTDTTSCDSGRGN